MGDKKRSFQPSKTLLLATILAAEMLASPTTYAETLVEAVQGGKPVINIRYRYENVDMDGMSKDAHANTVRSRVGYMTDWWQDLQAMVEFENITVIGEENYNDTINGRARPIVADPEDTELNQGYLTFRGLPDTTVKAGRQRIKIMNNRFVGNVGFRQNEQTFDSVMLTNNSIENLTATYIHVWNVNRINGNDHMTGDWNGNANWGSLSYKTPWGALTGYALTMDWDNQNAGALRMFSSQTYGGQFAGKTEIMDGINALYALDYARQSDLGQNPMNYDVSYYLIELGVSFAGLITKAGYEVLGSDWTNSFQTPLATVHAFQGVNDIFMVTPPRGIEDKYGRVQYKLSNLGILSDILLSVMYHDFDSEAGNTNYGKEWNFSIARKFKTDYGNFIVSFEFASFNADNNNGMNYVDVEKTWLTFGLTY